MATFSKRGPIDPKWGYFYGLNLNRNPEDFDELTTEGKLASVMRGDEDNGVVFVRTRSQKLYNGHCCSFNPPRYARCVFDYLTGEEIAPIAWMNMGTDLLCKKDLAYALLNSDLVGISIARAEFDSRSRIKSEWFHVMGDGRPCVMIGHCEPAPYKCWKCGNEPVCRVCGRIPSTCNECGEVFVVREEQAKGASDPRLVIAAEKEHPYSVVDLNLWDGADFVHGQITHRMLQFLLRLHAHPFRVEPLAVNVHGATKEDLARLEVARAPLP